MSSPAPLSSVSLRPPSKGPQPASPLRATRYLDDDQLASHRELQELRLTRYFELDEQTKWRPNFKAARQLDEAPLRSREWAAAGTGSGFAGSSTASPRQPPPLRSIALPSLAHSIRHHSLLQPSPAPSMHSDLGLP